MKHFFMKYRHLRAYPIQWILLCLAVFQVGVALAQINISAKQKSLTTIFNQIEKQSSYVFLYDKAVAAVPAVTIDCSNCSIDRLIQLLEKETKLEFKVSGQQVLVKKKVEQKATTAIPAASLQQTAQSDTIKGKVIDENGKPVVGATLLIKGTKIGTSTDKDGNFKMLRVSPSQAIIANSIGYHPMEVIVGAQKTLMVALKIKAQEIEDVVISTGFQKREKSKMIGNVSSIKGEDMELAGITSVDKALRGKMTGVFVRSASGRPGETAEIVIRGSNTMTGNQEPLIILDGMPLQGGEVAGIDNDKNKGNINSLLTNGIGNIPPEDIASIDILRDATAASIYGARAANGVIVITTKRGEIGKDYISYSGKQSVNMKPSNKYAFMNSREKLAFERQLYNDFHPVFGGRANQLLLQADNGIITHDEANEKIEQLAQTNTNWIDELYRPAYMQSHNIGMSGGNNRMQYNVSVNYQNSEGTLIENRFQMGGLNMKLSRNIGDKLQIDLNMYSTLKKNKEGQSAMDPFRYAMFANPYERPYNDDGSYAWDASYRDLTVNLNNNYDLTYRTFNMIRELRENMLFTDYGNVRGQFGVEYKFLKGFRYRGTAVMDYTSVTTEDQSREGTYRSYADNWLFPATGYVGVLDEFNQGYLRENSGKTTNYTVRNTVEYNETFAQKHFLQLFVANEISGKVNKRFSHFNPVFLQDYRMAGYPAWASVAKNAFDKLKLEELGGTFYEEDRSVSFISSLVYSYDNRYVLNANFRSDGVDIIGSKNQFTPLWSAGVKWNAHEEKFVKENLTWLNRFVISGGYGYTGSINRSVLPFHTYLLSSRRYADVVKASNFYYGNPVLKWEKKRDMNLGVQLSILQSRLNLEANYYDNKTTDLLDDVKLAPSVGRESAVVNNGILTNKGWEMSARVEAVKTQDWLWEIGANLTTVKNKLVNVYQDQLPFVGTKYTQNIEGYAINSLYGYKFDHVDPMNGHLMAWAQVRDQNESIVGEELIDLSKISDAELQNKYSTYFLGHNGPKMYGGFNTHIRYKNFDFTSNFVLASGNHLVGFLDRQEGPGGAQSGAEFVSDVVAGRTNRVKEQLNRWRQPGDVTDIPLYSNNSSSYTKYLLDRDIQKGGYIRCTELGFMYRLTPKMLERSILQQVKFGLYANNLFTITPYTGADPEAQTAFGYPVTRSYSLSLSVNF